MSTRFLIPRVLRQYCGGRAELELEGRTVRELLDSLRADWPAVHQCVCDETGVPRRHVNLFVNDAFLRDRDGLDTLVVPGDVVSVFQAVSGG